MLPRSQKKAWTEIFAPFPVERDAWWVGVWCMVCGGWRMMDGGWWMMDVES